MEKYIKIALAGNPNSGKTTLFNALTGSNQFVGNWPGVTVEKKEGKVKGRDNVIVTDLPGIYSLSPYTLEEVVARNYLIDERPDAILNIVDGTNLERNLYLTTQLVEIGIPVVIAINMMDMVKKYGDNIAIDGLSKKLGCPIVEISALKEDGIFLAIDKAIECAKAQKKTVRHIFSGAVEHAIAHIEESSVHHLPEDRQRWYAIKIFERDSKVLEQLKIEKEKLAHIETDIKACESELDDDAESIITNERYEYIGEILKGVYHKKHVGRLTTSDKIDKIVTNRWLALPIFAVVMFLVYFVSVTTVGTWATDWANDGLFGDGFHLLWIGDGKYNDASEEFSGASEVVDGFISWSEKGAQTEQDKALVNGVKEALDTENPEFSAEKAKKALYSYVFALAPNTSISYVVVDEETLEESTVVATVEDLKNAITVLDRYGFAEPDPASYGVWIPGIPVLIGNGLEAIGCWDWLSSLILDGVVAGVGAVLGFVPQILVLFLILAFLEACGYMARIAFVLDKIFRKFGLSGKSFIPMLIGTGCGVPGIMSSRTIENDRDRKMTIITTTFIPCGAKLPFIALIAGAIFGGAWWVAPLAYFIGMLAIVVSGIMLKKTKLFSGDVAPFVMELPAYHMPTIKNLLYSMWERGWSFIKKAGTIILLSTVIIWFLTYFGFTETGFRMLAENEIDKSILAFIGSFVSWIFAPLGFANWQSAVATITGLIAKENIVATIDVTLGVALFTKQSAMSFLIFNLLCAPCFAAMGAIKREMNNWKWTAFAIGYQTVFAYVIALIVYQFSIAFVGQINVLGFIVASILVLLLLYMIIKPDFKKIAKRLKKSK
ncbi:MAG: ferrous iron transporter B [Clostridia bacterium]|nr:ferrous iron transporter B [Clostridia bacterium]